MTRYEAVTLLLIACAGLGNIGIAAFAPSPVSFVVLGVVWDLCCFAAASAALDGGEA
jgi:hypothetical protein